MLTWTLIGRSHIGFHQMLKTIERMSRGGGEAGQRRARLTRGGGADWTNDKGDQERLG